MAQHLLMGKERALTALGLIFMLAWIYSFFEEFPYFGSLNFLWFCKISLLLLGLACLTKDSRYLFTFFAIGAIPELIWTADFISTALGHPMIGSTSFMFEYGESPLNFAANLLHIMLIPAALFLSTKLKAEEGAWKIVIGAGIPVIILSYLFSDLNVDLNCVHNLCYPRPLNVGAWAAAIVTAYILACAFVIEKASRRIVSSASRKTLIAWTIIFLIIGIAGIGIGSAKYSQSPHYTCESNSQVKCERFFMDRVEGRPFLQFSLSDDGVRSCDIEWQIDGKQFATQEVPAGEPRAHITIYLPNFGEGTREITSKAMCE